MNGIFESEHAKFFNVYYCLLKLVGIGSTQRNSGPISIEMTYIDLLMFIGNEYIQDSKTMALNGGQKLHNVIIENMIISVKNGVVSQMTIIKKITVLNIFYVNLIY